MKWKKPKLLWLIVGLVALFTVSALLLVGFVACKFLAPGKITEKDVIGTYTSQELQGQRLIIYQNGSYTQVICSALGKNITNSGEWTLDVSEGNADMTYVNLQNAISPDNQSTVWSLFVTHSIDGKRVLEANSDLGQMFEKNAP